MSTQVTYTTFSYSELDESAQAKARDWYINASDGDMFWSEGIADYAVEQLDAIGISVDTRTVHLMNGKTRQEQAVYWDNDFNPEFTARVNVITFLKSQRLCNRFRAIFVNVDEWQYSYTVVNKYGEIEHEFAGYQTPKAEAQWPALCEIIQSHVDTITSALQTDLRLQYDYQFTEECIAETMEINDYQFTESGRRFAA